VQVHASSRKRFHDWTNLLHCRLRWQEELPDISVQLGQEETIAIDPVDLDEDVGYERICSEARIVEVPEGRADAVRVGEATDIGPKELLMVE